MKTKQGRGHPLLRRGWLLLSVILILSTVSCKNSSKDAFSFREIGFCAEVEWAVEGEKFCVRIYNTPSQKLQISAIGAGLVGEQAQRYAQYVLPETLRDVRVELTSAGECKIQLEKWGVSSNSAKPLARILELTFGEGSAKHVGSERSNAASYTKYVVTYADESKAALLINDKTKLPERIISNGTEFNFVWFELYEADNTSTVASRF